MNKPSDQSPSVGTPKTGDQTQPAKSAPAFGKTEPTPEPKTTSTPGSAAKGNDEVMSQQPQKQT